MPIKESFMVKNEYGAVDLSLEAKPGESLLITDIFVSNPVANWATLKTAKTTVGFFRCGGNLGNHLPLPIGSAKHSHGITVAAADGAITEDHAVSDAFGVANAHLAVVSDRSAKTTEANAIDFGSIPSVQYETILGYLKRLGVFKGYPVAEGETFQISGVNQAGCIQMVIYEKYDAADILPTQENGSKAKKYMFLNYGRTAAVIVTSTSTAYDTTQSPKEFPDFPYAKVVPAKTKILIHGILASDIVDDLSGNDTMNSDYIKMVKERVTLFDSDTNGIFHKGVIGTTDAAAIIGRGLSLIGNKSDIDIKPPLMFPVPILFNDGEELNVYLTTTAGASQSSSDLAVADTEIALIETVERE